MKNIIGFIIVLICLLGGIFFAKFYQPAAKTMKIYKEALADYNEKNYQNAYYLFSKVDYLSVLKPVALYRQAMCAKELGDNKSLLRTYNNLFQKFPNNKLSIEARYYAGILLKNDHPKTAEKHFEKVINSKDVKEDYVIASKFHLAQIWEKENNKDEIENIKDFYASYLEKYPDGKFSDTAAIELEKFKPNLSSKHYTLIAKTYFLENKFDQANMLYPQTSLQDSWAIRALTSYKMNNPSNGKFLTELGVAHFADTISEDDFKKAISFYLDTNSNDKFGAISNLLKISKGERKDYIWFLKCNNSPQNEKAHCYEQLTKEFPKSNYTQKILEELFYTLISQHYYNEAYNVGKKYIEHFDNPKMTFWQAKTAQNLNKPEEARKYFKDVIKKHPDSYYAYRSFILTDGAMPIEISYKPIKYPYKTELDSRLIKTLEKVGDYEMISKISKDEFVKSWAMYKQGKLSSSVLTAKNAMDKLENKPPRNDLRWRLVYPMHYFEPVEKYSDKYENQTAMIYGIIREESYFNPNAGSSVGAKGLMQLMDATAIETAQRNGIPFQVSYLFNPETNIQLGNIYFAQLRKMLNDMEISTVAAYNGGIGSVLNWKKTLQYSDSDDFVEQIPYPETKEYVKKVLRSYWNYARLYNE